MALTLPKLALPKLALPELTLDKKRIALIAGAVVLLAAAGWFGWQYFEEAAPPPAKSPSATAAKAPAAGKVAAPADAGAARDKSIEDLLLASGLKQTLSQLPQKLMAGVKQSGKPKASPAIRKAMEDAVAASFSAQAFLDRAAAALKKDFEQKRVQALLKDYSTPAAKRMVGLEQALPSPKEFARFASSAAAARPSPQRTGLIKRIDAATRASDLAIEVAFSSMKGLAVSAAGGAQKAAAVDKAIERQRAASTDNIRNATLLNLAFSYRNASDAELEAYAKFYEAENSKWLSGIIYAALAEELRSASTQAATRAAAPADKPAASAAKPARSMARADARICLDLADNKAIMACAEKYR